MINEQIRDKEVRLIGEDGEQLGIAGKRGAEDGSEAELGLGEDCNLTAKPPVCKIIDYAGTMNWHARKKKPRRNRR